MTFLRNGSDYSLILPEYFNKRLPEDVKLSQYTYHYKHALIGNKIVFYNFISDAIILLNKREFDSILNFDFSADDERYLALQKAGFFTEKSVDESNVFQKFQEHIRKFPSDAFKAVIVPTSNCNARCDYCISKNNPRIDMTIETANSVVEFLANKMNFYKELFLTWYGGEPLLQHKLITVICNELQAKKPNINYSSAFSSNLAFLTEEVLEEIVKVWRTRKVNVTFDGFELEHNTRKKYVDNKNNGYQNNLRCIMKLLERNIEVHCRYNIDKKNVSSLNAVIKDLKPFFKNKKFFFFVSPLRSEEDCDSYYNLSEYNEMMLQTSQILIDNDVRPSIDNLVPRLRTKLCLAKSEHCVVIGPEGSIFRCNLSCLNLSNQTGNVVCGIEKNETYNYFANSVLRDECKFCSFLPICQGGCPEQRRSRSKTNIECTKFKFKIDAVSRIILERYGNLLSSCKILK